MPASLGGEIDRLAQQHRAGVIFRQLAKGDYVVGRGGDLQDQSRARDPTSRATVTTDFRRENLERAMGFEPTTPTLARLCSTPELRPRSGREARN